MEFQTVCVLGLGYIGLPTASTFATYGMRVVGVDVNPQVVHSLRNGNVHIYEPGLRTLVQAALKSGNLVIASQPEPAEAFIIAVPTPFKDGKAADLQYVVAASQAIVPVLRQGNLVVLESTSPPRTTLDIVRPILEGSGLIAGKDFFLAYTPERVLPGQILRELIENARVIGGIDRASAEAGQSLYGKFVRGEIILTDATTAEMVKLMENTYRDINIAAANEFARLADRFGVDVWEAIQLANRHPRVNILNPGPGVGGHCISVDPWFLVNAAPDLAALIRTARAVNDSQPEYVVNCIESCAGTVDGKRLAVLGLAYKADVDDMRESPAVEIAHLLSKRGARVVAFEPFKPGVNLAGVPVAQSLEAAVQDADILALLVGHNVLRRLDPENLVRQTSARLVFDCTNSWQPRKWRAAGFHLVRLGAMNK